ncbi:MAG: TIGR03067 domain-containing protein [Gemmataceae bacterium]
MKRLIAFVLVLGLLATAGPSLADKDKDTKAKDAKKADAKETKKDDKKTDDKPSDAQKQELEKLSGTFSVDKFERDGKASSADEVKKMKVVQKGAEWTFHLGEDATEGKDVVFPDKSPKEINATYTNGPARDKVVHGIYKIEGDTVTYVWAEPGKERPKEFASKADSGHTLMVLKRAAAEKPKDAEKSKEKNKDK